MFSVKKLGTIALVLVTLAAAPKARDANFETSSAYNKVDDTTSVYAQFWLRTSDFWDSLTLSYSFPGKKQTSYVRPKWRLSLYQRNNADDAVSVKVLLNDKGPAQTLQLKHVKHDNQFGRDFFEAELTDGLETALLGARTIEVFPTEGETAATCKISGADVNKLKTFLKNSLALRARGKH